MELDKALLFRTILQHNGYQLEFLNEKPNKGDILAKSIEHNEFHYVLVKGFKNANQTLFIYDFKSNHDNQNLPPSFDNAHYINTTTSNNGVFKCEYNYRVKYKNTYPNQIEPPHIPQQLYLPIPMPMPYFEIPEIIIEKSVIPSHIKTLLRTIKHECPICYIDIDQDKIEITECGHIFCKCCITSWLSKKDYNENQNDDCPTCRKKIF
jgi:hypothetical protein